MSSTNLARILHAELHHLQPRYARTCSRYPLLSPYPTLDSLVHRFTDRDSNKPAAAKVERSQMLAELQPAHDRLWAAILVAAFRPLVGARRFYGADPEECEAMFFATLTEVVDQLELARCPVDQLYAIVWLRTKKKLVRALGRQTVRSEVGLGEDVEVTADHAGWLSQPLLAGWFLSRGRDDRPEVDLVVQVMEWGSLSAYVAAEYAGLPRAERSRVYERLRERYRRTIAELRKILDGGPETARERAPSPVPDGGTTLRLDEAAANDVAAVVANGAR